MGTKVLAELVAEVIRSGEPKSLDEKQVNQFHREFETSVAKIAEAMRSEKRRVYDEVKTIAVM